MNSFQIMELKILQYFLPCQLDNLFGLFWNGVNLSVIKIPIKYYYSLLLQKDLYSLIYTINIRKSE